MDVGILSSQSFSFFFIILLPGERLKGAVVFLIGIFFVECSSICNCQVKWIRFACMVEDGKVCDASFFLEKAIPLRLPWKILLLFSKWADRVLLCFPVAGSAVGAQLLCIPLPYLPSASKQWELIFSCCFECWLFSADKRQPWLLDLAFILSRGTC